MKPNDKKTFFDTMNVIKPIVIVVQMLCKIVLCIEILKTEYHILFIIPSFLKHNLFISQSISGKKVVNPITII